MILTLDEVIRSLKGSFRLIQREADGFRAFDISIAGFWRSFAAIVLTLPAFVALLAERRLDAGPMVGGLFDDAGLVLREVLIFIACWIAFPLVMIGFVRLMGLERRYVGYVVAYNWSTVIAAFVLAFPAALHVLGLATPALAGFYTAAFGVIVVQYRWFLARTALCITSWLAGLVVGLDLLVNVAITWGVGTLVG
ncbi:MAG TPA: hypothetical protein VK281_00550 [Xanthobacteraceae bacterium]|nr:hypothetical protein [Xanthobacteraceae bacterium]